MIYFLKVWITQNVVQNRVCHFQIQSWFLLFLQIIITIKDTLILDTNNILKQNKLQKAIKLSKPDILIHMAAQPLVNHSFKFPENTFNTNAIGTMNVLSCIKKFKSIKSAVIVTTDKVYKNKNKKKYVESDELGGYDPYSSSKVCAEIITESFINSFFKEKN